MQKFTLQDLIALAYHNRSNVQAVKAVNKALTSGKVSFTNKTEANAALASYCPSNLYGKAKEAGNAS